MEAATKTDDRGQAPEESENKVLVPAIGEKAAKALRTWLERHSGKKE